MVSETKMYFYVNSSSSISPSYVQSLSTCKTWHPCYDQPCWGVKVTVEDKLTGVKVAQIQDADKTAVSEVQFSGSLTNRSATVTYR